MIITNTILTIPDKEFTFKDEIKEYLYQFVENHPFRILNKRISDLHGEDLFSMTFIPPNKVVLTQRYPLKQQYKSVLTYEKMHSISLDNKELKSIHRSLWLNTEL